MDGMTARFLRTSPCEDACGTLPTDRTVDGATVYRCPGCDAEWIELDDVTVVADEPAGARASDGAGGTDAGGA